MANRRTFGSIRKLPSGKYQALYWMEGKRHAGPQPFLTKADASAYLSKIETQKRTDDWTDPEAGKVTFKEYAERWRLIQPHRPGTAAQIEANLRNHVYPRLGERAIRSIVKSDVQALVKNMSEGVGDRNPLAPATVGTIYTWVASIFSSALDDRIIQRSPCVKISLPAVPRSEVDPLNVETVFSLIENMPRRYRAIVVLGAGTGVRISEALGLTNDRINWIGQSVTIDRQLTAVGSGGTPVFGPLKDKSNRPRTIPLPGFVIDELAAHVKEFGLGPSDLVFTGPSGGALRRTTFSDNWRAVAEPLGIPKGDGFHQLRHFYASLLIHKGESVKVIQKRLGHQSAVLTLDTYGHLWPDTEEATRVAVDEAFRGLSARSVHAGASHSK